MKNGLFSKYGLIVLVLCAAALAAAFGLSPKAVHPSATEKRSLPRSRGSVSRSTADRAPVWGWPGGPE